MKQNILTLVKKLRSLANRSPSFLSARFHSARLDSAPRRLASQTKFAKPDILRSKVIKLMAFKAFETVKELQADEKFPYKGLFTRIKL